MAKKSATTPLDDVLFVFEEVQRIDALPFASQAKEDGWYSLPHPGGSGQMTCGQAAGWRLEKLAEEAGRRAGVAGRVATKTLLDPLKQLLVTRFMVEHRPLDTQQVDRGLATAGKAARANCADVHHFIPCHLMTAKDPTELQLGPVVFRRRKAFRQRLLGHVRALKDEPREEPWRTAHVRRLMHEAIRYYRNFDWIAEVTIRGCDAETADRLAHNAVLSALDCLHLIFQAENTDQMRVGGPALRHDRRAKLWLSAEGKLEPSLSSIGNGQVNFSEGWSAQLAEPYFTRPMALCAVALETAVDPDLNRPLSRRFLDAAQWHGEAARDKSPSTRVVKYVTALERMLMTEERDDITQLVSERVAALCFNAPDAEDRARWREKTRQAYDLRSRLVHGSISPRSLEVWRGVRLGEELGAALLCTLNAFGENGLRNDTISVRRLGKWFGAVVKWADREVEAASAPAQDDAVIAGS